MRRKDDILMWHDCTHSILLNGVGVMKVKLNSLNI